MRNGSICLTANKGRDIYYRPLPVWFGGNVYFNGAKHCTKETDAVVSNEKVSIALTEECGHYSLKTDIYDKLPETHCRMIATSMLGEAFEPEEKFENPDGTPILFNEDILGEKRGMNPLPGPFGRKRRGRRGYLLIGLRTRGQESDRKQKIIRIEKAASGRSARAQRCFFF